MSCMRMKEKNWRENTNHFCVNLEKPSSISNLNPKLWFWMWLENPDSQKMILERVVGFFHIGKLKFHFFPFSFWIKKCTYIIFFKILSLWKSAASFSDSHNTSLPLLPSKSFGKKSRHSSRLQSRVIMTTRVKERR